VLKKNTRRSFTIMIWSG